MAFREVSPDGSSHRAFLPHLIHSARKRAAARQVRMAAAREQPRDKCLWQPPSGQWDSRTLSGPAPTATCYRRMDRPQHLRNTIGPRPRLFCSRPLHWPPLLLCHALTVYPRRTVAWLSASEVRTALRALPHPQLSTQPLSLACSDFPTSPRLLRHRSSSLPQLRRLLLLLPWTQEKVA
jgi:hypothetical protein